MRIILKLTFILILSFGNLKAQNKPIIAVCDPGKGCTFQISKLNSKEVDGTLGNTGKYSNMSNDAIVVFAYKDGKWIDYVENKLSRSALDRLYGGDGYTMIYPFNPYIQPYDGQWRVDIGKTSGTPCFVDINSMISKSLNGRSERGLVTFPHPFNVEFLMDNPNIKWRMINPSKYQAVLDFSGGPSTPMKLVYDIEIENEKKIKGLFTFTIKVPTKDPCISKIPITYTCVKPNPGLEEKRNQIDPFAEKKKFDIERLPDDKKANVERLPDDKPKDDLLPDKSERKDKPAPKNGPKVERLPDDKPKDDLLPIKSKPKDDLLPIKSKPKVDRLPDDNKAKVDRLPDDKPKDDLLPIKNKTKDDLLPIKSKAKVDRLPDENKAKVDRLPDDIKPKVKRIQ